MKAVLLRAYGGVDKLDYTDAPDPIAGPGEVLIRVISTSINPIDYKIRAGAVKDRMPVTLPYILGRDVAGEVLALGSGVDKFQVGDKVMGLVNNTYAQQLKAPADLLCKIPEGLDAIEAGALPLVLTTGSQLIERALEASKDEVVLVTGAAGGVGRTAVFVAKQHGAKVIAGVRAKQKSQTDAIGADSIVALDDEDEVNNLPELDAIADTVGGDTLVKLLPKLKKSGKLGSVLGKSKAAEDAGIQVVAMMAEPDAKRLFELAQDVRDGRLEIPIANRFPLSAVRQAQADAEKSSGGKILLIP